MSIEQGNRAEARQPSRRSALVALAAIVALGAFLRFYRLGATSIGNAYYAATVKSMLTSWHNCFFAAYEPGGSVTVDKPPLGFWIEAASARILGVNGFALALPNVLAGTLALAVLYALVSSQFGRLAGLAAALALAMTPITIAAERNNTIDGMLVFVLLLAAWAVWRAVECGSARALLLGYALVGLGFNIKMLQAYMVLPALYALYLVGANAGWRQRVAHLGAATGALLAISLAWALVVDATPTDRRPFIGSSRNNTVMELIVGHNGSERLLGRSPPAHRSSGQNTPPPGLGQAGPGESAPPVQGNPPPGPEEVGQAGIFRLFTAPLASQVAWLLPLALLSLPLALVLLGRPRAVFRQHLALILWAGWLLPAALYFSFTHGAWHTYYLIMLGPGLAALVGVAVWALEQIRPEACRLRWALVTLISGVTLGYQRFVLSTERDGFIAATVLAVGLWIVGLASLWARPRRWALGVVLLSVLIGPLFWSGLTTFNPQPEVNLPKAGPMRGQPGNDPLGTALSPTQQRVLAYLLAHTHPDAYLAATLDSHGASPYILASGRAFLVFGGYIGGDDVVTVPQLQEMVAAGELRFVVDNGNLSGKPEIFRWVAANCRVVHVPGIPEPARPARQPPGGPRNQQFAALYDCGS